LTKQTVESVFATLDIQTKGDLSSFYWKKSYTEKSFQHPQMVTDFYSQQSKQLGTQKVRVHYAALNFRDVMIASDRMPSFVYPQQKSTYLNLIGNEFSGVDPDTGSRI